MAGNLGLAWTRYQTPKKSRKLRGRECPSRGPRRKAICTSSLISFSPKPSPRQPRRSWGVFSLNDCYFISLLSKYFLTINSVIVSEGNFPEFQIIKFDLFMESIGKAYKNSVSTAAGLTKKTAQSIGDVAGSIEKEANKS